MQSNRFNVALLISALIATLSVTSWTVAQTRPDESTESSSLGARSADQRLIKMMSKHQEELNERLTKLRAIKLSLGENHPSLEKVNEQIADAERGAEIWATPVAELLSMSDQDLRVFVLELAIRVGQLEQQIGSLKASNQPSRPASIGLGQRPR